MHETQTLLETDPAVAMDVKLGQSVPEGQSIEFNYQAYRDMIHKVAGHAVDASDLTITLTNDLPVDEHGHYETENVNMKLRFDPRSPSKSQTTLQHETQHFTDDTDGLLHTGRVARASYNLATRIIPLIKPVVALDTAYYVPTYLNSAGVHTGVTDYLAEVAQHYPAAGFIPSAVVLGAIARYHFDPDERKARKAEKHWARQVISVQPANRRSA